MTPNDVKIVAENIDDFIEVPDGINRLRKAILTLAISGNLVIRNSTKTETKKYSLKELPGLIDFFDGDWVETKDQNPDGSVRLTQLADIGERVWRDRSNRWMTDQSAEALGCKYLLRNDVLIARMPDPIGRACLFPGSEHKSVTVVDVAVIRLDATVTDPHYVMHMINADIIRIEIEGKATGTTRRRISRTNLGAIKIPLPSISEQKRIVDKVQEVMKQLDELETKKRERDETRVRLARSAMQSLGKGESKIAFEHLTELVKTPADLKELEDALLTLAVSGKLVSQDKKDGTAEALYDKIRSEMGGRDAGRKKKTKEFEPITTDETPFDIPKTWKWVRLIEIGKLDTGKTPRTGVTGNYTGDIPFIGPGDVQNGKINSYSKLITKQGAAESKYLRPGDVLMVCIGGTIGKTALVNDTHTFNQQINKITPYLVDSTFLFSVFQSGYFQKLVWSKASGGATPLVNLTRWSSCVVPLPPLTEQKRIVKKVKEVMSLVGELKKLLV